MASTRNERDTKKRPRTNLPEQRRAGIGATFVVAAGYAAMFVLWTWPLALQARTHVPVQSLPNNEAFQRIYVHDEFLSVATAGRNARAIAEGRFADLIDTGLCYPVRDSAALGEHMIETSILAVPGWWLSHDPVYAFNFALLAQVAIAGAGMFALVRYFTASFAAAFVAGLMFAFFEVRIVDLAHPAVRGTHWVPFILLFFDRLIVSGKTSDAAGLAVFALLGTLTGAYPLLILATFAAPYGLVRIFALRVYVDARRMRLLVAAVAVVALGLGAVLYPYFSARAALGVAGRDMQAFARYTDYLPSGVMFAGYSTLVLALVGACLGRSVARGVASAAVVGAGACFILATAGPLWSHGPNLPSIYAAMAERMPILTVVRVPAVIAAGVDIGLCLAAGLGLATILSLIPLRVRRSVAAVAVVGAIGEFVVAPLAVAAIGGARPIFLENIAPSKQELAAYAALDNAGYDDPVVDLPLRRNTVGNLYVRLLPRYVLLAGYHSHRTTSCYNSYLPPSLWVVQAMAERLPDASAVRALEAAGLRNVVMHEADDAFVEGMMSVPGNRLIYRENGTASFRLAAAPGDVSNSLQDLAVRSAQVPVTFGGPRKSSAAIYVKLTNRGDRAWASADPGTFVDARLRFTNVETGVPGPWIAKKIVLPFGIAPRGEGFAVVLVDHVDLPSAGRYRVDVSVPALGWTLQPETITEII